MLEPISGYLAGKRMARLQHRLNWIIDRVAEGGAPLHMQNLESEQAALQWAIDELRARYPDTQPPKEGKSS